MRSRERGCGIVHINVASVVSTSLFGLPVLRACPQCRLAASPIQLNIDRECGRVLSTASDYQQGGDRAPSNNYEGRNAL
jgi:hypothetical protein